MPDSIDPVPESEAVNLVLLGSFNPAIFQPQWFVRQGLVRPEEGEGENCKIEMVRAEVAAFALGPFRFEVQPSRFQLSTESMEAFAPLRDLAIHTFRILEHTPLTEAGLSRGMHFRMPSENEWHGVGHRLAPKELWKDLLIQPGMSSLRMTGKREGSTSAGMTVVIEPSRRVKPGVFVLAAEDFKVGENQATELLTILGENWEPTQCACRRLAVTLLERCLKETPHASS